MVKTGEFRIRHVILLFNLTIVGCVEITTMYTGYLMNSICWEAGIALDGTDVKTAAHKHTVTCALLPQCVSSGFIILQNPSKTQVPDFTVTSYSKIVELSANSTSAVTTLLKSLRRQSQIYASVKGSIDSSGRFNVATIEDAYTAPIQQGESVRLAYEPTVPLLLLVSFATLVTTLL